MQTVAVTGSTGFIGKHLIDKLRSRGFAVIEVTKTFESVECDRIYHLACPSTTEIINNNPTMVMDVIMDATRQALQICPDALFINASSMGANFIDESPQGAYNIAKRCMEVYIHNSNAFYKNYRLPSVYGRGAHADSFIMRCVNGTAYEPTDPNKVHYIAHIDEVVNALIELRDVAIEEITLGEIYKQFSSGQRSL